MSMNRFDQAVRAGIESIPAVAAHSGASELSVRDIYVVNGHEKALNPDAALVVGDRGSGKSFWCAALSDPSARQVISQQLPRLHLDRFQVVIGFAGERSVASYPSAQILKSLLDAEHDAEVIWRTVILFQVLTVVDVEIPGNSWLERVKYVNENPEQEEQWLAQVNTKLQQSRSGFLIVFDALDRLGGNWPDIRNLTQGLLKVCLDMRSFSAIHIKLFMRPDMWADKSIWAFPDASKLQHNLVLLEWLKADLYGLFWHWLANRPGEDGKVFREKVKQLLGCDFQGIRIASTEDEYYPLPQLLKVEEPAQEQLLNLLSTPFMGANKRRGKTYTWLPNHLSDAKGHVSPRSFLLAIKRALEVSEEKGHTQALHYDGIKAGVSKASEIRIQELKEDYPWINEVLTPLQGLSVPAQPAELLSRWKAESVLSQLETLAKASSEEHQYLPPYALESTQTPAQQLRALVQTLVDIGVVREMPDGRVNIPDLFRVGAGIGRRGGVRPVR